MCATSSLELYFNKIRHLLWWISDFVAATSTFGKPAWHPLNFHLKKTSPCTSSNVTRGRENLSIYHTLLRVECCCCGNVGDDEMKRKFSIEHQQPHGFSLKLLANEKKKKQNVIEKFLVVNSSHKQT